MSIKDLKIGIPTEYFNEHLSSEVYEVWNEVANILESDGASVKQVCIIHFYWFINKVN